MYVIRRLCKSSLAALMLVSYSNQEGESVGSQALDNVVMLSDVIRHTITDESSSTFSQVGEFISKHIKYIWLGTYYQFYIYSFRDRGTFTFTGRYKHWNYFSNEYQ